MEEEPEVDACQKSSLGACRHAPDFCFRRFSQVLGRALPDNHGATHQQLGMQKLFENEN